MLLLGLARDRSGDLASPFSTVVRMFIVAYVSYVSAALMYSNLVRQDDSLPGDPQAMQYSMAMLQFYRAVFVGWIALSPLLRSYLLEELSGLVDGMLLVVVLGGWLLTSTTLYRLGYARGVAVWLGPTIALIFTVAFAVIVNVAAPVLRSATSLLYCALTVLVLNVLSFGTFTLLPGLVRHPRVGPFVARNWHRFSVATGMASIILLAFLWMSAAGLI